MGNLKSWWQGHRPTTRRLAQLYAALLYNANLKGFAEGQIYDGAAKAACVPGLNCYSCPGAVGACPLGALQNALAVQGTRAPAYVLGILMLFGLLLGRTICGWLCPMGLIQELLHKIPTHKIKKSRVTRALSWLKYGILAVFVIALPLWYGAARGLPLPAFCKYLCPAGTLEGAVGLLSNEKNAGLFAMLGALFTQKFVILAVIGLACVFCYRAFCRFLCPLGAIYGLFSRVSLLGVKVDNHKCVGCGACVRHCPMDVRRVGDHECIHCGKCGASCGYDAIAFQCGSRVIKPSQKVKRALQAAAIGVLVFALCWFNLICPQSAASSAVSDAPVGYEVGQQLADFTVETLDGSSFHLSDTRGKPVLINLWATYCAPCVRELDYFSQLQEEHPEAVILAVHSSLVTEDVAAYLRGRAWQVLFAVDTDDDVVFSAVGGSSLLPQTLVLNTRGEVIYNQVGSVTYEQLQALLEQTEEN